jgi:diadenosine tetraphosphate (Ap4A) HIT family hydrolase
MMADLHPQLERDCLVLGRFRLCYLLLARDANYPWFILVPDRADVSEIHQLEEADRLLLLEESVRLARVIETVCRPDKLNIAALGNMVPQLHVHHIARYRNDPAWPAPVWGARQPAPYVESRLAALLEALRGALADGFEWCADPQRPGV